MSTQSGIGFATTQDVTVPIAVIEGAVTFKPGVASVGVTAAGGGHGRQRPGRIRSEQVPPGFSPVLLKVTNPAATTGGTKTTTTQIQKADTDAAWPA